MAAPRPTSPVTLFIGSEPEALLRSGMECHSGEARHAAQTVGDALDTVFDPIEGTALPPEVARTRPLAKQYPRRVWAEQAKAFQLVCDVTRELGLPVHVVDINGSRDPGVPAVQPPKESETLPVLVRADGARLAGIENFTGNKIRRFLEPPKRPDAEEAASHPRAFIASR